MNNNKRQNRMKKNSMRVTNNLVWKIIIKKKLKKKLKTKIFLTIKTAS